MVDPLKTYAVAWAAFTNSMNSVTSYAATARKYLKDAQVNVDYLEGATKDLISQHVKVVAAFEVLKKQGGLSPDKATEHLKAVAAVLKLAEESGVSLTEGLVIPTAPIEAKLLVPWQWWTEYQSKVGYKDCRECGTPFKLAKGGWLDDNKYNYCSITCLIKQRGTSYYPSYPTFAVDATMGYPAKSLVLTKTKNSKHASQISGVIKERKTIFGLPQSEGWLDFSKRTGMFRPDWKYAKDPSEQHACRNCKARFNIMEGGWKDEDGNLYCSRTCVIYWSEANTGDACMNLTLPNLPSLGVGGDGAGCTCDYSYEHWFQYAKSEMGWTYPVLDWAAV